MSSRAFWRSPSARSLPGSGLGLSIVERAVRDIGGRVAIEDAPGGGTLATAELLRSARGLTRPAPGPGLGRGTAAVCRRAG
ncbi:ATP-binding protein [Microbispora bryophytorum]|uniref:ATP-binding protein n=1 Tax=Microbispora bryophytorum TaxID=1460882 RepID=UPI003411E3A8